jgi:hypothetical protein
MTDTEKSKIVIPEKYIELIKSAEDDPKQQWIRAVWDRSGGICSNCGSDSHLSVRMIVPEEAGGKLVVSNGMIICRTCEVAKAAVEKAKETGDIPRRPVNVWISRKLYTSLQDSLKSRNGFRSMGPLARYMIGLLVDNPDRFSDLDQYQDRGSDVKINLWLEQEAYESFKQLLNDRNMTVTDGIKGLMLMYTEEGVPSKRRI